MTDSANTINQRVGVFEFPYSDTDVDNTDKTVTDLAQSTLLSLFQAAINDELTGVFAKVAAGTALDHDSLPLIPVRDVWPGRWSPQVAKQRKTTFPVLALYRTGAREWNELTLGVDQATQKWGIDLILGPVDVGDQQRIERILPRIGVLVQRVLRNRGHKSFQSGACLWGVQETGSLSSVWMDKDEFGPAQFVGDDGGVTYLGWSAQLTTTEVDSNVGDGDAVDLLGTTFTFGVGGSDGVIPGAITAISIGEFSSEFSSEFRVLGT